MVIVETASGEICNATVLANSQWEFIEQYLPGYSQDNQVLLSNDLSVVQEVSDTEDPYEYMKIPESERDYSNAAFEHVAEYVKDLRSVVEIAELQRKIDNELFNRAIEAYKNIIPF